MHRNEWGRLASRINATNLVLLKSCAQQLSRKSWARREDLQLCVPDELSAKNLTVSCDLGSGNASTLLHSAYKSHPDGCIALYSRRSAMHSTTRQRDYISTPRLQTLAGCAVWPYRRPCEYTTRSPPKGSKHHFLFTVQCPPLEP